MKDKKPIFRDRHLLETEISLPWIDRIRMICGSRLFVNVVIETQWRQEVRTSSSVGVEKVFAKRHTAASPDGEPVQA